MGPYNTSCACKTYHIKKYKTHQNLGALQQWFLLLEAVLNGQDKVKQ